MWLQELTRITISLMRSNSSGWRKAVNSSLSAAWSPFRSAVLNLRSSRGSIFLKLNWSVASSNSSGLAKRVNKKKEKKNQVTCHMYKHFCYNFIVWLQFWMNSYPGSIHMWPACIHPMKSYCLCSGHNLSTLWPHSRTHNASAHVLSKPWVRLWWCSHLRCCLSGPLFYWETKRSFC